MTDSINLGTRQASKVKSEEIKNRNIKAGESITKIKLGKTKLEKKSSSNEPIKPTYIQYQLARSKQSRLFGIKRVGKQNSEFA